MFTLKCVVIDNKLISIHPRPSELCNLDDAEDAETHETHVEDLSIGKVAQMALSAVMDVVLQEHDADELTDEVMADVGGAIDQLVCQHCTKASS